MSKLNLKVKYQGNSFNVPNAHAILFADFKAIVAAQFGVEQEFSLFYGNQKDEILLNPDVTMNHANLVNGDIVYIRVQGEEHQQPTITSEHTKDTVSHGSRAQESRTEEKPVACESSGQAPCAMEIGGSISLQPEDIQRAIRVFLERQGYQRITIDSFPQEDSRFINFMYYQTIDGRRFNINIGVELFRDDPIDHGAVTMVNLTATVAQRNIRRLATRVLIHQGIRVQDYLENTLIRSIRMTIQGWENEENTFLQSIMNPRLIEITAKVLSFLQPREILNLERTCSISNRTCQDPVIDREIWRNALRERFGEPAVQEAIQLRETFRATYILHTRLARQAVEDRRHFLQEERRRTHPYWPWPQGQRHRPFPDVGPLPFRPLYPLDPLFPEPYNPSPWNPDADWNPLAGGTGGMLPPRGPRPEPGQPRIFPFVPQPDMNPDPDAPQLLQPRRGQPDFPMPQNRHGRGRGGFGGNPFDPSRYI